VFIFIIVVYSFMTQSGNFWIHHHISLTQVKEMGWTTSM